mmetsp:Transcript_36003/g.63128  ORF Transcript_36003/g.63128 Transcript_36003/m.63128 type:complete len:701 (+) Transcript_36003:59-2161(+)
MTMAIGRKECPCTNVTGTFASLSDRHCDLPSGENGIRLTLGGSCVPFSYGSSQCLLHDLLYDPRCNVDDADEGIIEAYCVRPFCYVDVATCKRESYERVYRSSYFPFESEVDIFYSYSTCNSSADDWLAVEEDIVGSRALGGISIDANVPYYVLPMMYKRDPSSGEIISAPDSEYYDDNIPYEGVYINYVKMIEEISKGDIQNITLTHRSKVSSRVHPGSSFTAAVQDIKDGLVDLSIGPFWITGQRLKMASFTLPLVYDKTFLVIPRPGTNDTYNDQIKKVLAPLSGGLWGILFAIILVAALLSVWFSDRSESTMNQNDRRMGLQRNIPKKKRRKIAYARLALDSFLQKGSFFFSAGVDQDENASLPNKLLLFGFGFFILIAVSAYVANLAAFLTLSTTESVNTMNGAVAAGMTICAHPALKAELEVAWPDAKFYFNEQAMDFAGMLEDLDAGKCRVMAVGYEDTSMDTAYLEKLCERDLVYTDSLVVEVPIAFPIRANLAAGFSYWMYQGERLGVLLQTAKDEFPQETTCNIYFPQGDSETSDYAKISVKNMFLPIMFFVACTVLAVILQIIHLIQVKRGVGSLVGRRSTLTLVTDSRGTNRKTSWSKRRSWLEKNDSDSKEDEEENFNDDGLQQIISTRSIMTGILPSEIDLESKEEEDFIDDELHQRINSTKSITKGSLQLDVEPRPRTVTFNDDS